ncbi:MAG: NAD(P)-binding domain-containing protein, partial [Eggerthellaceae bacterium]|nr:NAD(P)-binding domain-containing protein [Eggerthellaceae bacterium]
MSAIRIGILGYGNLGRGVELACRQNDDVELVAVFTRRDPASVTPLTDGVAVYRSDDLADHVDDVDVLVLGGGSATDLPEQTPACARLFNVVDSFDTHANIPAHF